MSGLQDGYRTASLFKGPSGVAVDWLVGQVFVSDTLNNCIRVISSIGYVRTLLSSAQGAGLTQQPAGLLVYNDYSLYIADRTHNSITLVTSQGIIKCREC